MQKTPRFIFTCLLALSVLLTAGTAAWGTTKTPVQAALYVSRHPHLAAYLANNPQVDQQVMGNETARTLIQNLVQEVDTFGSGYVQKHPNLATYLKNHPGVAKLIGAATTGGTSTTTQSGSSQFTDVPSWAQQAVQEMAAKGIIKGLGNGLFGPNQTLTRAQFAVLLVREFGLAPASTSGSVYGSVDFTDVPTTFWAYNDIEAAAPYMTYWNTGGQAEFHPTDPADREDCMVAMVEAAGLANQSVDASSVLSKFADASSITPSLVNLVAIAVQSGMITGSQGSNGNWYLTPQATLTRAQGAVLLYRALSFSKVAPGVAAPPVDQSVYGG